MLSARSNTQPEHKTLTKGFAGLCLLLLLSEIAARVFGVLDFPTYHVDEGIGYIPQPNQHGTFLHRHDWVFNDRSMGTEKPWNPTAQPNILLIGNSVVMGGNPYDQNDKLGPLMQGEVGKHYSVWPIAAGGWTNVNETVYLKRNADVARAATCFIWEYMSGGLSGLTPWAGEYVWPTSRPVWGSLYAFRRYLLPRILHQNTGELPRTGDITPENLASFKDEISLLSEAASKKGIIFLYPTRAELVMALQGKEWLPERPELMRIAHDYGLKIVDISLAKEWNATLYRNDGVHPTVEGNIALARILAEAVKERIGR